MKVFITGIEGFLGRRLAERLVAAGQTVAGSSLGSPPELGVEAIWQADLVEPSALEEPLARFGPDVVIHLAGFSHVGQSWNDPGRYFQVNVLATENVLSSVRAEVPVVFASSAEVYGPVPETEQPIVESRKVCPITPYGLTKAAAERLVLAHGGIVVRSFNLVGAGQAPQFALPSFALQLAAIADGSEPILRVGNLSPRRDFVHVEDGAEAYALLAERGRRGTVYNLASGHAPSIGEALKQLIEISGQRVEVVPEDERMRSVDTPLLCGCPDRLTELGWKPERSLAAALEELWDWARKTESAAAPSKAGRVS